MARLRNDRVAPNRILRLTWFVGALLFVFVAALPLTIQSQMVLAAVLVPTIIIMKRMNPVDKWGDFFIILTLFVVTRYIFWRTAEAIPFSADPTVFGPGILLYFAEMYAYLILVLGVFLNIRRITWPTVPLPDNPAELPTVDVFIPSYSEDPVLLRPTLLAAKQMRYPREKLNVYLLDDGGTTSKIQDENPEKAAAAAARRRELEDICAKVGAHYLTRPDNENAKAGNLNTAFHRTGGELIAIFDADHVPTSDFLEQTVGHFFEDRNLFLVQTPHFFINADPFERNLGIFGNQPNETAMFYEAIKPGLDYWNAAFFCGSAAVLKRRALEKTDGFKGASVTEDCETSVELHSLGFSSRYVRRPLVAGLQPETLEDFIRQRTRWAQGMTQIFVLNNPLLKRGLSIAQKLAYTSSMMFWQFAFARLAMVLAPLVFLFFGLEIYQATVPEFIAYAMPAVVCVFILPNYLYGRVRPPLVSEVYEFLQCTYLLQALVGTFLRPRKPTFVVTPKGRSLTRMHVSPMVGPLLVLLFLMVAGVGASVWRLAFEPALRDVYLVVTGWNLFNLFLAVPALGVALETPQRRRAPRVPVKKKGVIESADGQVDVMIRDMSATGVRLQFPEGHAGKVARLDQLVLRAVGRDRENGSQWQPVDIPLQVMDVQQKGHAAYVGASFLAEDVEIQRQVVHILYGDSREWVRQMRLRRHQPSLLSGFRHYFRLFGNALSAVPNYLRQRRVTRSRAVKSERRQFRGSAE